MRTNKQTFKIKRIITLTWQKGTILAQKEFWTEKIVVQFYLVIASSETLLPITKIF